MSKTGAFTLGDAAQYECPIARTMPGPLHPMCRSLGCTLFREMPMTTTPAWAEAVKRVAVEIGEKNPAKPEAARTVAADPEAHGLVRLYFCGLGGRPE